MEKQSENSSFGDEVKVVRKTIRCFCLIRISTKKAALIAGIFLLICAVLLITPIVVPPCFEDDCHLKCLSIDDCSTKDGKMFRASFGISFTMAILGGLALILGSCCKNPVPYVLYMIIGASQTLLGLIIITMFFVRTAYPYYKGTTKVYPHNEAWMTYYWILTLVFFVYTCLTGYFSWIAYKGAQLECRRI
uniref:Uncharacterized protein n=1 Tax=Acrobeloides nanus TaxID=290746 RepID=A0A914DUW9_9BILA